MIPVMSDRAPDEAPAVRTVGLGKRYGSVWALDDCTLTIPRGRISALLGPNGAGKTTLLRLLVGLASRTTGDVFVLGREPEQAEGYLASVGYLAQEVPLYKRLTVEDHFVIGAHMNANWDDSSARERIAGLRIPFDRAVATLSGGQRSQVALGLALSKNPRLLLLDEPVAALDPLARREFLVSLAAAVAESDLSVVLSSHLVHDLERVCDHVVLLAAGRAQVCGDIDDVVSAHRMLVGPRQATATIGDGVTVIRATHANRQSRLLVHLDGPWHDPIWETSEVGLEEIVLAYMGYDEEADTAPLSIAGVRS